MEIRKTGHRRTFIFLALILVIACSLGTFFFLQSQLKKPLSIQRTTMKKTAKSPTVRTIRLIASGDMIPHDSINKWAQTGTNGWDYTQFFTHVKPVFEKADIRFCNQEVPTGAPATGAVSGYPVFNAPTEFARDLQKTGCNVINTATNHANDKQQAGIDATLNIWDNLPKLSVAGTNRSSEEQQKIRYFTIHNTKFAFLSYNFESNNKNLTPYGVNMFDETLMKSQLAEAKKQNAYTLVSVHWGTEDSSSIDAAQEKWSQFLADHGADVVIGTGPHVIEPVKKLPSAGGGEALVWYSIGNMLSSQLKIEELIGGFAVMDFEIKNNVPVMKEIGFLPTYMHYEWTDSEAASENLLARKNIKIYMLEESKEPLAKSQHNTTVEEQTNRVEKILNQYTPIKMLSLNDYGL